MLAGEIRRSTTRTLPANLPVTRGGVALLIGRLIPLTILLSVIGDSILGMQAWNWVWLALGALAALVWIPARRRSTADRSSP